MDPGLSYDGLECADADFGMVGHWYCDRAFRQFFLHDDVTAATPYFIETVPSKNFTNLLSRKDLKLDQKRPRPG